jgi:hypothetical protein
MKEISPPNDMMSTEEKHHRARNRIHEMNISIEKNMRPGLKDERKTLFWEIKSKIRKKKKTCLSELGLQQTKERVKESLLRKISTKYYKQWKIIQGRVATMGLMRTVANTYKYFGICGSRLKLSDSHTKPGFQKSTRKQYRIYPEETSYSILASATFAVFCYSVLFFPLCIALGEDFISNPLQYWCTLSALVFLCLGIVFRLFTVDMVEGKHVDAIPQIFIKYARSFLIIDFLGSMPFEYAVDIRDERVLSALYSIRLFRVSIAVLSERKLGKYFYSKIKSIVTSSKMMKVLETLFFTLLILHCSSCMLLLLWRQGPQCSTWLSK